MAANEASAKSSKDGEALLSLGLSLSLEGQADKGLALMEQGGSMLVRADDPAADEAERTMLADYGMRAVVAAGAPDTHGGQWLVEVFADAQTGLLGDVEPALRLLTAEAVGRAR